MNHNKQPNTRNSQPADNVGKSAEHTAGHLHPANDPSQIDSRSLGDDSTLGKSISSLSLGDLGRGDGVLFEDMQPIESRYRLEEVIGRGGMGEVWRAIDIRLNRPVAVKRIKAEIARQKIVNQRFLNEARAIAQLNHINAVQVYDFGSDSQGPYLVMEYVDGQSLADFLKERGKLEPVEAVDLIGQICDALAVAHERGIIHRDIKPANILLTADGVPKLTDFGLARLDDSHEDDGLTRVGAVIGTPYYMAPEQSVDSSSIDARSDQWSIAATLYSVLSGHSPRNMRMERIPSAFHDVISVATEDERARRFSSIQVFKSRLNESLIAYQPSDQEANETNHCTKCGFINAAGRKFCGQCGNQLMIEPPCPECGTPNGHDVEYCGQCGTNIPESIRKQQAELANRRNEIQQYRGRYDHARALEMLAEMATFNAPHLAEFRDWAVKVIPRYEAEREKVAENVKRLRLDAQAALDECRYHSVRRRIERIPEALRIGSDAALLDQVISCEKELESLITEIRTLREARSYEELAGKLSRFLELNPREESARRLLSKLAAEGYVASPVVNHQQTEEEQPDPLAVANRGKRSPLWVYATIVGAVFLGFMLIAGIVVSLQGNNNQIASNTENRGVDTTSPEEANPIAPRVSGTSDSPSDMSIAPNTSHPATSAVQPSEPEVNIGPGADVNETTNSQTVDPFDDAGSSDIGTSENATNDNDPIGSSAPSAFSTDNGVTSPSTEMLQQQPNLPALQPVLVEDKTSLLPTRFGVPMELGCTSTVRALAISPDQRYLATGSNAAKVRLWEFHTGKELWLDDTFESRILELAFTPDSKKVWVCTEKKAVLLECVNHHVVQTIDLPDTNAPQYRILAISRDAAQMAVVDKGLVSGREPYFDLFDLSTGEHKLHMPAVVPAIAFDRQGRIICGGVNVKLMINVWDNALKKRLQSFTGLNSATEALVLSDDQTLLAASCYDKAHIWRYTGPQSGQQLLECSYQDCYKPLRAMPWSLAISPNNRYLAIGGSLPGVARGTPIYVETWDIVTGRKLPRFAEHGYTIAKIVFSPDGRYMVTSSSRTVYIWRFPDGDQEFANLELQKPEGPTVEKIVSAPPKTILRNTLGMEFQKIAPGSFVQGSPETEAERGNFEGSQFEVSIEKPFCLGMYEVTQSQWQKVMQSRPLDMLKRESDRGTVGPNHPMYGISWFDAVAFCNALSKLEGKTPYYQIMNVQRETFGYKPGICSAEVSILGGEGYRLPTEMEWEYACRAGTTTPFSFGEAANGTNMNCNGNYPYGTDIKGPAINEATAVGSYAPNNWGLYDMHGNIEEWCYDVYHPYYEIMDENGNEKWTDPKRFRVLRGGSWESNTAYCRSATRGFTPPGWRYYNMGFRIAYTPSTDNDK